MPWCGNLTRIGSNRHFKTVGNAPCPVYENDRGFRREDFACGCLEKVEPTVEMFVLESQFQMWRHGAAFIIAGLENNRRPERGDLCDVMIPIMNRIGKDRPDDFILACASIESGHKFLD